MPPEAEKIFARAGVKLVDADLYRVAEAYNFWAQKGDSIWPGADISSVPVQFVFPEKLDVLIGHPDPPPGCVKEDILLPGLNRTFCHRPDRTFQYGFVAGRENDIPTVSLNTMETFENYANAQLAARNPGAAKYSRPYMEYLGSLAHELLHAYQYSERARLPEEEKNARKPVLNKLDYPYQDEEKGFLLALEGRVLADLLEESDPGRAKELWLDFIVVRSRRRQGLPRDIVLLEQYMELTEGTAKYAGDSVQYGDNSGVRPLPETAADPRFSGYASSGTLRGVIRQRLLSLDNPLMGRGMSYAYETGMALAYSLDTAAPGWKKDLFRRISGFRGGLDGILTAAIKSPGNPDRRLAAVSARYDGEKLRAAVRGMLEVDLAEGKAKLEAFRAAPGKRYRLVFPGVKPADLLLYYPGVISEYKDLRLLQRGATQVSFDMSDDESLDIKFSRSLPALYDRGAGTLELAVADAPAQQIKAGRTKTGKGVTLYSGGGEYDNGVFSWKGGRLEVSEKDGVTTLAFRK